MSPLYVVYRDTMSLSATAISMLHVGGAIVVLIALLCCQRVTTALGTIRCLRFSLYLGMLGAVVGFFADHILMASAARMLFSLGQALVGIAGGVALAATLSTDPRRAGALTSFSTIFGCALGPLLSGVIEYGTPIPFKVTYALVFVMCAVLLIPLHLIPETQKPQWRTVASTPRLELPSGGGKGHFLLACFAFCFSSGVFAIMSSSMPLFLKTLSDISPVLLAGISLGAMFLIAMIGQMMVARMRSLPAFVMAILILATGIALFALSFEMSMPLLLLAALVAIGLAHGQLMAWTVISVNRLTNMENRGGAFSVFMLLAYGGASFMPVMMGAAADRFGQSLAIDGMAIAGAAVCIAFIAMLSVVRFKETDLA